MNIDLIRNTVTSEDVDKVNELLKENYRIVRIFPSHKRNVDGSSVTVALYVLGKKEVE